MIKDIARNRRVSEAEILREALSEYLGGFSTIPTMKQLVSQVGRHEQKLTEIEKILLKKGLME